MLSDLGKDDRLLDEREEGYLLHVLKYINLLSLWLASGVSFA